MFNLIKDDFDENTDDILNSINKILNEDNKQKQMISETNEINEK